jgi:hypothetical protein
MPGYNDADEGSGDSGVMQPGGPSRDAVKKLDQIIQVWQFPFQMFKGPCLTRSVPEFSHQSRSCYSTSSSFATCRYLERRLKESQQMGKPYNTPVVRSLMLNIMLVPD